jgi:hypothetical protein
VTVGEVTRKLIATLEGGGPAARECLLDVSELLRKAWHPGFAPAFAHLQAEDITAEEAGLLRQALADYCQAEGSAAHRRTALATLAKERRPELQAQLEKELHLVLQVHRVLSGDLFQLLLALEDVGESVFPKELRSRGIDAVQANVDVAAAYLRRKGTLVPY